MTPRSERWAISSAIVFAVLYVAGFITLFSGLPSYDSTQDSIDTINKNVIDTYSDPTKRGIAVIGAYVIVIAVVALVYLVSGLRARMRRLGANDIVADLVFATGVIAAVLMSAGALTAATIAGDLSIGNEPLFSADVMRALPQVAYPLILIGGMLALAVVIGVTSWMSVRGHLLPRWLGYFGVLAFLAAVSAVLFVPQILVMLWFLAIGIVAAVNKLPEEPEAPGDTTA